MQEVSFEETLETILAKDPRYQREVYLFVREALDYTQKQVAGTEQGRSSVPSQPEKHVTAQQLLEGIRQCALEQFGPMAITVLNEWGICHCRDFGEIVFNMIEAKLLRKTAKDSRTDFEGGYDFEDAFRKPFLPTSKPVERHTSPLKL